MVNSWFNFFGGKQWLIRGLTMFFGGKTMVNSWFNYVFGVKQWLIRGLTMFLGVNHG